MIKFCEYLGENNLCMHEVVVELRFRSKLFHKLFHKKYLPYTCTFGLKDLIIKKIVYNKELTYVLRMNNCNVFSPTKDLENLIDVRVVPKECSGLTFDKKDYLLLEHDNVYELVRINE